MKHIISISLLVCLISFIGCGKKLPADFPKVYPMKVTVMDGTTPLPKVKLVFYPSQTSAGVSYASTGSTDESGVAIISTSQGAFYEQGIPAGEFVVTVNDINPVDEEINKEYPPEKQVKMSRSELVEMDKIYKKKLAEFKKKVPEKLCRNGAAIEERSPIRFTAKEGTNELTIDIAEYKK